LASCNTDYKLAYSISTDACPYLWLHEDFILHHPTPLTSILEAKPTASASALVSNMSLFFGPAVDIDVVLEDTDERQMVDMKLDKNRREKAPLYMDGESVKGAVTVRPKDGKRLEHTGIKVQFIGVIGTLRCLGSLYTTWPST
jgi:hypothetical protein